LLRAYTDNPLYVDAPSFTTRYLVEVRCSSNPDNATCKNSAFTVVTVLCPSTGTLGNEFATITAPNKNTLQWTGSTPYSFAQGLVGNLSSSYPTTSTGENQGPATSFDISGDPLADVGYWWLFRVAGAGGKCNAVNTYGSIERDTALIP